MNSRHSTKRPNGYDRSRGTSPIIDATSYVKSVSHDRYPRNYGVLQRVAGKFGSAIGIAAGVAIVVVGARAIEHSANQDQSRASASAITKLADQPHKEYTVQDGDTVWGIATAEGPAVADSPEGMFDAERIINAQIPKNGELPVGKPIMLPESSDIGTAVGPDHTA
jgi:hypothetical protein